jgi:hypothetical protein
MATEKQIAANRANAQKSTGPRSPEGKSASSRNSLKSGIYTQSLIIRGEDPAELKTLRDNFYEVHCPQAADERALVDTLISNEWTLRRLRKCAAQIWESAFALSDELRDLRQPTILADAFADNQQNFLNLQRPINAAERAFHRALLDLQRLKKSRPHMQLVESEPASVEMASFPQNPPDPPTDPQTVPAAALPDPSPTCALASQSPTPAPRASLDM